MTALNIKKVVAQWLILFTFAALSAAATAIDVGDSLIIDNVETIDGQVLTRESLKGKYLIVQVWATWCPYCHRQNLNLIELTNRTKGKPLEIIALSVDRNASVVPPYVLNHGLNFHVAMMTTTLNKAIGNRRGVPELYVVDPTGKIIQKDFGEMVDLDVYDLADYVK
jgi:thiol-disulfide isomerase/thioredoxin